MDTLSYVRQTNERVESLEFWKQLAFLTSICQRLIPCFDNFLIEANLVNTYPLNRLVEKSWIILESGITSLDLSDESKLAESIAPDTEEYDFILVSSALDAAVAVSLLMKSFSSNSTKTIIQGVALVFDSIDMYVQTIEDLDPQDNLLEDKIFDHVLMQNEIEKQRKFLALAEEIDVKQVDGIRQLKDESFLQNDCCLKADT